MTSLSDCISGLSLTVQNYKEAVNILKERYANPQVIISAHMESLVELPAVRDVNNVSLRKIYDRVASSIRNLKSVGINPDSYGSLLTPLLTEKLPSELRMIIARKFSDEIWNLGILEYCLGQHASSKCTKIASIEARLGLSKKFARCLVCLKKGHVSKNCDSKYKCNKCSSRHHISICDNLKDKTAANVSTNKNSIQLMHKYLLYRVIHLV